MKLKVAAVVCWFIFFGVACQEQALERLIQQADGEWIKGRNQSAIEILKGILKKESNGPIAEKVLFRLGEIYYFSLANSAKALFYFRELQRLNKKSEKSFSAQKYVAEIAEFAIKDLDQAIIEYQKLIDQYNYPEENAKYQYRIASIYFKKQDYEQTIVELEILLENFINSPPWVEEAAFRITSILYTQKRCAESRERYRWFVKKFPKSRFMKEMDFIMAACFEEEGQFEKAYEGFKALEGVYPYPTVLRMKLEGIKNRLKKKRGKKKKSPYRLKRTGWTEPNRGFIEFLLPFPLGQAGIKTMTC